MPRLTASPRDLSFTLKLVVVGVLYFAEGVPYGFVVSTLSFYLRGQGVALGVFSGITLEEREIDLEWGDIVVFYTDGITEAPNAEGEMFGVERIEQLLSEHENRSAHAIAEQIKSSVVEFEGPGRQFDDLTMVLLKKSVSSLYG